MPTTDDLIAAARSRIGMRWLHQGRTEQGVDCVGLVLVCLRDLGIEVPDMPGYRRSPHPIHFIEHIRTNTDRAPAPAPGMMGVFRDGNQPCHVGIFAEMHGQLSLIHAYAGLGKVLEEPFIHDWPRLLIETRRLKGII